MRRLPAHPGSVLTLPTPQPNYYPGNDYDQAKQPKPVLFQETRFGNRGGRGNRSWSGGLGRFNRRRSCRFHSRDRSRGGWCNFGWRGFVCDRLLLRLLNYRLGCQFHNGHRRCRLLDDDYRSGCRLSCRFGYNLRRNWRFGNCHHRGRFGNRNHFRTGRTSR